MTDRLKTLTAALPLIAVAAIALVYIRAWAIFRQYDPDWVLSLSAADVFSMGWAMTPTMLIAGVVGVIVGGASREAGKPKEPSESSVRKRVRGWRIVLIATSAMFVILSYALMMMPLGIRLSGKALLAYPIAVMWLTLLHSHAAFRVTTSLSSFSRVAGLGAVAAMVAFWDWEGAAKIEQPMLKRITLDDGRELCRSVIFSGQTALFLWDVHSRKAIALERRLVTSVTKEPNCRGKV